MARPDEGLAGERKGKGKGGRQAGGDRSSRGEGGGGGGGDWRRGSSDCRCGIHVRADESNAIAKPLLSGPGRPCAIGDTSSDGGNRVRHDHGARRRNPVASAADRRGARGVR